MSASAEIGAVPSIGSVGDSYDNALAETVNGLYKTELIRGPGQGPWRTVEDVELATSLGLLVQQRTAPRLLERRAAGRVRGGLRCPTSRPATGWNPITRASIKPRANQSHVLVVAVVGARCLGADMPASNSTQRSVPGPSLDRCPPDRWSSDVWTVTSKPAWRTTCIER